MRLFFIAKAILIGFCRKQKLSRLIAGFLVFLLGLFQPITVFAQNTLQVTTSQGILNTNTEAGTVRQPVQSYSKLVNEFIALQEGKDAFGPLLSADRDTRRTRLLKEYEQYLDVERTRLRTLGIHPGRQKLHLETIEEQMRALGGAPTIIDKVANFVEKNILRRPHEGITHVLDQKAHGQDLPALSNPSSFSVPDAAIPVVPARGLKATPQHGQTIPPVIRDILTIEEVQASSNQSLPTLNDLKSDGGEVLVTDEIRSLALSLNNNPVEIFNYLSNTILLQPYAGAAKGSEGCLKEKACNDIDSASLAIALLRASGIPARYGKGIAIFTPGQLKEVLAVEDLKSAASILLAGGNGYRLAMTETLADGSSKPIEGVLKDADLSRVSSVAVEWVYPEAFIEYGERGGNAPNVIDFSTSASDQELQTVLGGFPSMQWMPFDAIVKPHDHAQKELLPDTAGIDAQQFWSTYLSSGRNGSPVRAYADDVKNKTGKDFFDEANRSKRSIKKRTLTLIPPVTPYVLATGAIGDAQIDAEKWSSLPDDRRLSVTVSLLKATDQSAVFEQSMFGSVANNADATISYKGATDQDEATIKEYDGIANTPPSLVSIVPTLSVAGADVSGTSGVTIGTSLVLRFTVKRGADVLDTSEKYSVAGNVEGFVTVFSSVQKDHNAQSADAIVLAGPAAIARAYLDRVFSDAAVFSDALDYRFAPLFARAVVTDNRVIKLQNGTPISFEFSGLSMDACLKTAGAAARGAVDTHRKEFHLIGVGLNPSYYESQIFADLAGLDGISTVTGLQYAYSRQSEYTVKTITSQSVSDIDALELPSATKEQMRKHVAEGGSVVTPTKPVTKDAWSGILYVSLRPDFTATYAIGEQVTANGGRSTDRFRSASWEDEESGKVKRTHQTTKDRSTAGTVQRVEFIKKEDASRTIMCTISNATFENIVAGQDAGGWSRAKYGVPCYEEKLSFGKNDHRFVAATDGAYFKSTKLGYEYWKKNSDIQATFFPRIPRVPRMGELFAYWGTYAFQDEEVTDLKKPATFRAAVVYSPSTQRTYRVEGQMGERYVSGDRVLNTYIPGLLGFPTSEEVNTAKYEHNGTSGTYQQFVNGTLYARDKWWSAPDVHPVIGAVNEKHNELGGTAKLGFPTTDPEWAGDSPDTFFQNFQDGTKMKNARGSSIVEVVNVSQTLSLNRQFSDQELPDFTEGMQDGLLDLGIAAAIGAGVGLSMALALKVLPEKIAKAAGAKAAALLGVKFIPLVGWVFAGATVSLAAYNAGPLFDSCNKDVDQRIEGKAPAYFCGLLIVGVAADLAGAKNPLKQAVKGSLNKLGVTGKAAQAGKTRFIELLEKNSTVDIKEVTRILQESKVNRTPFFEHLDLLKGNISDDDLARLAAKPRVLETLLRHGPLTPYHLEFIADTSDLWKKTFKLTRTEDRLEWWRVKSVESSKKGGEGEKFMGRFIDPEAKKRTFDANSLGERDVDRWDPFASVAYEIKNHGKPVRVDSSIEGQIKKDVYLRTHQPPYRPVWVFIDQGPDKLDLEPLLRENNIEYLIIGN